MSGRAVVTPWLKRRSHATRPCPSRCRVRDLGQAHRRANGTAREQESGMALEPGRAIRGASAVEGRIPDVAQELVERISPPRVPAPTTLRQVDDSGSIGWNRKGEIEDDSLVEKAHSRCRRS